MPSFLIVCKNTSFHIIGKYIFAQCINILFRTDICQIIFQLFCRYIIMKKRYLLLFLTLICLLFAGCSKKGAAMPKHRKRKHCDCPYFSYNPTSQQQASLTLWL